MTLSTLWAGLKSTIDFRTIFDVGCVSVLLYRLLLLVKGTRAWQITVGLGIFFLAVVISDRAGLYGLNWLLRQAFPLGPVAIVILFLPELRHALEEFGRPGFWGQTFRFNHGEDITDAVDAVVTAVCTLSIKRIGALIVFERETALEDIIATGIPIDGRVSSALLCTIFHKDTPLHDGAVIIRGDTIVAAACTLPLTASPKVDAAVHTRHKAALGMSEDGDGVVVVVSEETGTISLAVDGRLVRGLRDDTLRLRLGELLQVAPVKRDPVYRIGRVATRVSDALRPSRMRKG